MSIDVRTIADTDFDAFCDAASVGFYHPEHRGTADFWRRVRPGAYERCIGAFDGPTACGTFRNLEQEVTVPGGASLRVGAVTAVTVLPTHRRRGLLSRMMQLGLRQSADAGEALSILIPAEYPIYGRFGYGRASEQVTWRVDARSAPVPIRPLRGEIGFVSARQWCDEMVAVHDRVRAVTPGAILREPQWWEMDSALVTRAGKPDDLKFLFAVVRDDQGVARGYARYQIEDNAWRHFRPASVVHASLLAETPEYYARLVQFLAEQDWAVEVEIGQAPVDDAWRHLFANPRLVAQTERIDVLWARVLDAPVALAARTYGSEGRLVLGVEDKDGYASGTFALEAGPDGSAVCRATTESADLTMPVQSLGSLYFGGVTAASLSSLGLIAEERSGALALADRMFGTVTRPHCVTWF